MYPPEVAFRPRFLGPPRIFPSAAFESRGLMQPTFDIFRGTTKADGIWLESVEGLSNSEDRMHTIAAETPGCYFVFANHDQSIRARTETKGKRADTVGPAYSR